MTDSMRKYGSLSEAKREAKAHVQEGIDLDVGNGNRCHVLRPDGYTDTYAGIDGKIVHTRKAGWTMCGQWIDPSDAPCIVF